MSRIVYKTCQSYTEVKDNEGSPWNLKPEGTHRAPREYHYRGIIWHQENIAT